MKRSDDCSNMPQPDFGPQFRDFIRIRCPSILLLAVRDVARRRTISASAYMRQAIVDRLARDSIDLNGANHAYRGPG
jgi:hypothetical protein